MTEDTLIVEDFFRRIAVQNLCQ